MGKRARKRGRAAAPIGPGEKPGCQICGTTFVEFYRDGDLFDVRCGNGHTPMQSVAQRAANFDAHIDTILQPEMAAKVRLAERRFEDEILGL